MLHRPRARLLLALQGRWKWALQYFALAKPSYLHPCQLLAAIVPALLGAATLVAGSEETSALLDAARVCLQKVVSSHATDQSAEVSALFAELLDAPPAGLLTTLVECRRSLRPRMQDMSSCHARTLQTLCLPASESGIILEIYLTRDSPLC